MSFDEGSGSLYWTWLPTSGSASMVAATEGNGLVVKDGGTVVRLDSTGAPTTDAWMTVPPSQSTSVDPTAL